MTATSGRLTAEVNIVNKETARVRETERETEV